MGWLLTSRCIQHNMQYFHEIWLFRNGATGSAPHTTAWLQTSLLYIELCQLSLPQGAERRSPPLHYHRSTGLNMTLTKSFLSLLFPLLFHATVSPFLVCVFFIFIVTLMGVIQRLTSVFHNNYRMAVNKRDDVLQCTVWKMRSSHSDCLRNSCVWLTIWKWLVSPAYPSPTFCREVNKLKLYRSSWERWTLGKVTY